MCESLLVENSDPASEHLLAPSDLKQHTESVVPSSAERRAASRETT